MRLIRLLVLLAVVWLVVELAAIPVAGRLIEQQVAARSRGIADVDARVGTFPVLTRFVTTGSVNSVAVTLDRVVRLGLTFTEVRFDLDGVGVDRGALLTRKVRITHIDTGTVTATIDLDGLPPGPGSGTGRNIRVAGRSLVLGRVTLQLSSELFPCDPRVRQLGRRVIASCVLTDVPPILLDASQMR